MSTPIPFGRHTIHPPYVIGRGDALPQWVLCQFGKDDRIFHTEKAATAALARIREAELAQQRPWSQTVLALPTRERVILDTVTDFLAWCAVITMVERLAFARALAVVLPPKKSERGPFVMSSFRDDKGYLFARVVGPFGAECETLVGAEFYLPLPTALRNKLPQGEPDAAPLF